MDLRVAAFTDSYLPTVNGVTYTIATWRDCWEQAGGRMDVVYPRSSGHDPQNGEHPVRSLPFPFYDGYRLGLPTVPDEVDDAEVVHAHTPFGVGLGGLRLASSHDVPFVASYHTPAGEYAEYLSSRELFARNIQRASEAYERWFFDHADAVIAPSESTREHLEESVGLSTPVYVVSNGVDIETFQPVDTEDFLDAHGLTGDRPLVGYTGRHGYEKRLHELIAATADLDVTVVLGGDGPARPGLERQAADLGVDVRFLGFLDREELPAFYAALDIFAFPSPVETQGIVAMEANACGTPVVGANAGALSNTVVDGETGYHFESGDIDDFRTTIQRALYDREMLAETCLAHRDSIGVDAAVDQLAEVYAKL